MSDVSDTSPIGHGASATAPAAAPATLAEVLAASARRFPDRPAILADREWTFADLADGAARVAGALAARGVVPGDRVALAVPSSPEALTVLAGIAFAGAAVVLFDARTPERRRATLVAESGAALVVVPEPAVDAEIAVDTLLAGDPLAHPLSGAEAYLIFTSGSTGTPKGVSVSHSAITEHVGHAVCYFGLTPADRVLQFASLGFDVAQEEIWPTWAAGAAVVLKSTELPDPDELAQTVARQGVSVLQLPTAYWRTVTAELGRHRAAAFSGVRLVVVGGEAAGTADYAGHANSALGAAELVNCYGPTECVVTSAAYRLRPGEALPDGSTAVPIGTAFPGRSLLVLREDCTQAGLGDDGELHVSGVLADGYAGRDDLTHERFVTGLPGLPAGARAYRTGDVVRVLDGYQLQFRRRVDDQVKLRGYRIELGEVDAELRADDTIADAATAILARDGAEPQLLALIVPRADQAFEPAEIAERLGRRLPSAFVPTVWARGERLPLTASGKLDRAAIAHAAAAGGSPVRPTATAAVRPAGRAEAILPDDGLLTMIAAVWSEVLGVADPSADDDFLASGGDSLLAVRFASRARGRGYVISPAAVLREGTIAAIAAAARPQAATAPAPVTSSGGPRISLLPSQLRWLLDGTVADVRHFVLSALLRIPEYLPDTALLDTARVLVEQHLALSSRFDLATPDVRVQRREPSDLVSVVDLPAGEDFATAIRSAAAGIQASMDPADGRVFRLVRLRQGDEHRLLVVVHHLVLDGWSMALLVDDIETALTRWTATGQAALDEPTGSIADTAEAIQAYVRSDQARSDATAWCAAPWADLAPLPDRRAGPGLLPSIRTSRAHLDAEHLDLLLHRLPRSIGRPVDLLRVSIMTATAEWTGNPTTAIDVYDSHRAAAVGGLDLSRTIGYLQSTHPEIGVVTSKGVDAVLGLLAAARFAPPRPYGFDALRFLSPDEGERRALAGLPRPALRLNYRSQLDRLERRSAGAVVGDADEDTGAHRAPTQTERYDLMFEGDVLEDGFVVGAKFSADHFAGDDVDALTSRVAELMAETVRAVAT